jgi:TRAP-type mannitol/chloroaromatic compound transport system substrate-binding protein
MKRRRFLAGAGAAAAASPLAAPAIAQGRIEWRMVTLWPRNFPGLGTSSQRLVETVAAASDGRLTIKVYGAGELVPAYEAFDAVREGTAECAHDAPYIWIAKHPAAAFFCTVPGGLTPAEHAAWIEFGGGQALWDELYDRFALVAFLAGNSRTNMGGWYNREINGVEDFEGLRMRIPGLGAEVLNRLGATTVNLSGGEIVPALQTGVIDAAEWIAPYADLAFGLHKVAKYYYGPGVHEPGPAASLMIGRDAWDSLPADLQAIVRLAAAAETTRMPAETLNGNAVALQALLTKHGVDLRHFPAEVVARLHAVSREVVAEVAEHDELSARIYESWSAFRDTMQAYAPYGAHGYLRGRAGPA